jgi:Zn-dependent protease with chaperone function
MIHDVAKATSQARPEDVYLLADVNAFVTHRGGMMGFGSRRVMGIGLPLIKGLSPAELRSVIAHEFGHYVSGDVALGPWIHKTRAAIGRTLHHLGHNWLLTTVFAWYARMFMRMTTQISREQSLWLTHPRRVAGTAPAIGASSASR